jgi:lipoprotein-releasing system ATP-binding protein
MTPISLQCTNLSKSHIQGNTPVHIFQNLNLSVHDKEFVAILGPSGSGKSTLLQILGGLDDPSSGEILIADESLLTMTDSKKTSFRNKHMGFVFQFHHLLPDFNALQNVMMPLLIARIPSDIAKSQALEMLERVNLSSRSHHFPSELSGGERQRVAIARALVARPRIVFADEPTGSLDLKTASTIIQLIKHLQEELNVSFVIATHDLTLAQHANRQLHMQELQR